MPARLKIITQAAKKPTWLKEETRGNQKQRFWSYVGLLKKNLALFLCMWCLKYLLKFYSKKADSQGSLFPHLKILMISKFLFSSHLPLLMFFADLYNNSKSYMTLKDSIYVCVWHINVKIRGWGDKNFLIRHHTRGMVSAFRYSLPDLKTSQCKEQLEDSKERSQKLTSFLINSNDTYWHYKR